MRQPEIATALVGGLIFTAPSNAPIRDGVVVIRDDRIVSVGSRTATPLPTNAQILDCTGCSIAAGFWNCHVHFTERKWADAGAIAVPELERQLQDMLTRYGFVSVFDLSSTWENTRRIRNRIDSGEVRGPKIRSTGEGLVPANPGLPGDAVLAVMGWMRTPLPETAAPGDAAQAARRLLDAGVDGIKVFVSSPSKASLSAEVIQAAATEAHRSNKPVFAHPNTGADVRAAIEGGVDIIAHTTPQSGPWDDTILAAAKARRLSLTPTLTVWKHFMRHDRASVQDQIVRTSLDQLKAWRNAGGAVLFGNDLGAVEYDPADEYALMSAAGMTLPEILAALTTAPSAKFGEDDKRGRVAPGLAADLVVLKGDPSQNLSALSSVKYTLRDGRVIYASPTA